MVLCSSLLLSVAMAGSPTLQPHMGAPLSGLTAEQVQRFLVGLDLYSKNFAVEEGLGPGFNQTSCASCHNAPVGGAGAQMVTRFGRMDKKGGFDPLAELGGSLLQANAIGNNCQEVVPGGANVTALRVTPGALGYGLIEAIPDAAILAVRDAQPASMRGAARIGIPIEGGPERVGRFGWKAQLATIMSFSADASLEEMGITSALLPVENAPQGDWANVEACDEVDDPEEPFVDGVSFTQAITDFQRYLAAPPQMPRSGMSGEAIFIQTDCAVCHHVAFTTRDDNDLEGVLRNVTIQPYSDWLLHDMGAAADGIADGTAGIREMRTPPLWGVRRRSPMWHDGRVAGGTFETRVREAIALHGAAGSEGIEAAAKFDALSAGEQAQLIHFLDSLGKAEFDATGDDIVDIDDFFAADGLLVCSMQDNIIHPDDACAVHDHDADGAVTAADLVFYVESLEDVADCDGNGTADIVQIFGDPTLDLDQDGVLDVCEPCPADIDGSGLVDANDILAILSDWGPCDGCPSDIDGDGMAGVDDILEVISGWGPCP